MQEIVQLSQQVNQIHGNRLDRLVQMISFPVFGRENFIASPAQFGPDLSKSIVGEVAKAEPYNGCAPITNPKQISGKIAVIRRGDCMFQEKVKFLQDAGAIAAIIIG